MEVIVEPAQSRHAAREPGDVGEARRAAVTLAETLGMDETDRGRVALVVTEAGTNLIKHAGGGEILLGTVTRSSGTGIEIIAVDSGPGIADINRSMVDGVSTQGTPGNGLGGIRRLSSHFDLHTDSTGTVLVARILPDAPRPQRPRRWRVGAVCVPLRGEAVSGDAWGYALSGDRLLMLVVDGLGHGRAAFDAAQDSIKIFREHHAKPGVEVMRLAHSSARGTRGSAAAIADVNLERRTVTYTAIGNTSATMVSRAGGTRSMISSHGVLGADQRVLKPYDYPWTDDGVLVMHSDGLSTKWDLAKYPGLLMRDPSLIAAVLYRDHSRPKDDVSVVVSTAEAP